MLQEAGGTSYTPSVHPLPWGTCHFLLEWATLTANFSSISYYPFTAALPCLMEGEKKKRKGKEKRREAHLHPWRSKRSHLEPFLRLLWWWTILTIRVQEPLVLRKALSCRVMDTQVQREHQSASWLEKMTGLFSLLPTLLQSPSDGKSASSHSAETLSVPSHNSQHALGLWWVLFPSCSNGPPNEQFKEWTICLWGFWVQLIPRGDWFPLW